MYRFNDLSGKRFERLCVQRQNGRTADRHILWECKCDCGKTVKVSSRDLVTGHTKSCGCLQREATSKSRYKHGDRGTRLYMIWSSMWKRCVNPKDKSYKWYGALEVTVCNEWKDYSVFKKWALENGYNPKAKQWECTIDRIDPYGNYAPENCRWVNMKVQSKNKRKKVGDTP